jgi:transglutaminase-like putative cysteine protease
MTTFSQFNEPITFTLSELPEGREGVKRTLAVMSSQVTKYKSYPPLRLLALKICSPIIANEKNYLSHAQKIYNFVQQKIGYVRDIRGVETVQSPIVTLQLGAGDCDDKSTLSATLLECVGLPTRFVAMGFFVGRFSHVVTQVNIRGKWVTLDCTENRGLGWIPPNIKEALIHNNR